MKALLLFAAVYGVSASVFAWNPVPAAGRTNTLMLTKWGEAVTPENAWRFYPRPQMVRKNWTNLNGLWEYAVTTNAAFCMASPWDAFEPSNPVAKGEILVPFAIESSLSGVGRALEPSELLWYRRSFNADLKPGERLLLHFGGVDFRCGVFIGHKEVTDVPHEGGLAPFSLDITDYVKPGANELIVWAWDPTHTFMGAWGKQVLKPGGICYTRTSGIWQTVWMETVPETYVAGYEALPDIDAGTVSVSLRVEGDFSRAEAKVEVLDKGAVVAEGKVGRWNRPVVVKMPGDFRLWSPEEPNLYDLRITLKDGATGSEDVVAGYFAMRKFSKDKDANGVLRFFLNNKPYFIYGTLDQGWWPDGLLTPPSDEAMAFDVKALKSLGCNMMRKHQKVEPARYYRICDELGFLVIQDMPTGFGNLMARYGIYRSEFRDVIDALRTFPSVVMWGPYNEGGGQPGAFFTHSTLDWVKRYDPSRLVNGPSGYWDWEGGHCLPKGWKWEDRQWTKHKPAGQCEAGDTVDMHLYRGPGMHPINPRRISFLGEFGGLGHRVKGHLWKDSDKNWGYGGMEDTSKLETLKNTYLDLIDKLVPLARNGLAGAVYTQTTDVEEEVNGLFSYDRKVLKFPADALLKAHRGLCAAALESATTPQTLTWRVPMRNAPVAFARDGKGTVAFLGGSITEMNGYRPLMMAALTNRFPKTAFTFTSAGIGSTCSDTGAFRFREDVLEKGVPDLLFVEFAVNDAQDGHFTREHAIRGLEGVVRQARLANPSMDIVMILFLNVHHLNAARAGRMTKIYEAHDAVAERYGISVLNVSRLFLREERAGRMAWADYADCHPRPKGNAMVAAELNALLDCDGWRNEPALAKRPYALPAPLDAGSYFRGRFLPFSSVKLGEGWSVAPLKWRDKGDGLVATTPGAECSFSFKGTALGVYHICRPDDGVVELSIDDGAWKEVSLWSGYSPRLRYPHTVMLADDLADGAHEVRIRLSGKKASPDATGTAAQFLRICVNGVEQDR